MSVNACLRHNPRHLIRTVMHVFAALSSFVLTEYNKWKVWDAAYMHFAVTAQNTVNRTRMETYNLYALGCFSQVLMVECTFQ